MSEPIDIGWQDLTGAEVDAQVARMQRASAQAAATTTAGPAVRQIGTPEAKTAATFFRGTLGSMLLAGAIGGVAAWLCVEVLLQPDSLGSHWYGNSAMDSNLAFSSLITVVLGLVIALWEAITLRSSEKAKQVAPVAAPVLLGAGLIGGFLADKVYEPAVQHAIEHATNVSDLQNALYLPRAIGIAIIGIACGGALGIVSRSPKRAGFGAVGGAVGGFLGGLLFNAMAGSASSGVFPRLVAIVVIGVLIGVGAGLVEQAAREHWLQVASGGMTGKQFILYHPVTLVGSSPACQITLVRDPQIVDVHARLERRGNELLLEAAAPVLVNGAPVTKSVLPDGASVQIGGTLLTYGKRNQSYTPSGLIRG